MPSDPSVYDNFNKPTTALLSPFEIAMQRQQLANSLAQGRLNDQAIQGGALDLQQKQLAVAGRANLTRLLAQAAPVPGAAAVPPVANALAPGAADAGGVDPVTGDPSQAAGAVAPPPGAAPPVAAPPGMPAAAPAAAPVVPARPAVPTLSQLLGAKVPYDQATAVIEALQKVDKGAADIDDLHSKTAAALQDYTANAANAAVKSDMNPAVLNGLLAHMSSLGPQYAQMASQVVQHLQGLSPADQLAYMQGLANQGDKTITANAAAVTAGAKALDAGTLKAAGDQKLAENALKNASALMASAPNATARATVLSRLDPAIAGKFEQTWTPGVSARDAAIGTSSDEQIKNQEAAKRDAQTAANEAARLVVERGNAEVNRAAADPWGALGLNKHAMGAGVNGAPGSLHGDDFLATLPPQMGATVKAVAEGRQTNLPRGGKELDQLMGAVNQFDPSYSVQRAQQRSAFMTGAGAAGKNIGNLNTAVVHLDQYHEVMKAMDNGTFQPGNQLYNWAAAKFGSAKVTDPNFVRQSLAGEAASALKGNATDPEIAHVLSTLDPNQSPGQQAGTALAGLKLFAAKLNTYDEQYHVLSPDDPWSPVLPSAKRVFDRYGITPLARDSGPAAAPAAYKVGDPVMYNGKPHKVTAIDPKTGKLSLDGSN